jgi:hypothetical protein
MTAAPHSGMDGLAEDQRRASLGRFQTLLPYLKEGVSLARIAQEQKQIQRLPNRWAAEYRRLRVRGRCFKFNAHKDKQRTLPTIQQLFGRLAVPKLHQLIPTVTEVDCESLVVSAA